MVLCFTVHKVLYVRFDRVKSRTFQGAVNLNNSAMNNSVLSHSGPKFCSFSCKCSPCRYNNYNSIFPFMSCCKMLVIHYNCDHFVG